MNKACAALAAMGALLVAGCGLKDDLYIATEKPEVASVDAQSTGDQSANDDSTEEKTDQSSEQAP